MRCFSPSVLNSACLILSTRLSSFLVVFTLTFLLSALEHNKFVISRTGCLFQEGDENKIHAVFEQDLIAFLRLIELNSCNKGYIFWFSSASIWALGPARKHKLEGLLFKGETGYWNRKVINIFTHLYERSTKSNLCRFFFE